MSIIQIDKPQVDVNKGIQTLICCSLIPSTPLDKLNFSIANPNIVKIVNQTNTNITIEGIGHGSTTITVSDPNDPNSTNTITCNVIDPYYTQMFEKKSFSKLYVDRNDLKMFKGDIQEVKYQFYPCFLMDSSLNIVSSNENVVKIAKQIGTILTLEAVGFGTAQITLTSVEDSNFTATISVNVINNIESPTIFQKSYVGKKVIIILDNPMVNGVTTLVDFGWDAKNEIDMMVNSNRFEFEVPSYETDYFIRIAYRNGSVTSQWLTENIKASERTEEEIEKQLQEEIQRTGISLTVGTGLFEENNTTKYKVFFSGVNVDSIEYKLSFETEDKVHTVPYTRDNGIGQKVIEVVCPDDYQLYKIKARGLNAQGKITPWIEEYLEDVRSTGGLLVSKMQYNFDGAFCVTFEEGDPPLLYGSVQGGEHGMLPYGSVFTSDTSNDDENWIPCNCNVPIHMVADEDPEEGRNYAWGTITDGSGGTHYVEVGKGFFANCYNIKSLCYENCLGQGLGGFILYDDSGITAGVSRFDLIKRDNFAVAGVLVDGTLFPVAGFKLLQDTKVYDITGNEITILQRGNWVWMTSQYATLGENDFITGGEQMPGDIQKMAIHSYSKEASISEILKNWALDSNGNKHGIYFMDSYFNLGMSAYAIDTRRLSNRRTTGRGDIANGYFDFDNYGTPALLWSGSKYAIRSSIDNTSDVGTDNVVGYMHQCYLMATSTGEDISKADVGNACVWSEADSFMLGKVGDKFTDRHKVEEFYFAKGFFDIGNSTNGYFVGKKYVALCTPEWRHSQNGQHIGFGGKQFIVNDKQEQELSSEGSTGNEDNPLLDKENLIGISNTVLSSFFPFIQYLFKRIRKKCVEATGAPLDLLQVVCSAYKSNFAIYNDPINGVEINEKKSYKPLYGVKVLNDNTKLYVQSSMTSKSLDVAQNSDDQMVTLNAGAWVWFSEDYPPKIAYSNENCISIIGYSLSTDENGDPEGQVLIAPCYVDAGLDNVSQEVANLTMLDKIKQKLRIDTTDDNKSENDISYSYSALHYNIATMANLDGNEPHLLYEDDYYGRVLENTLCYNNTPNDIHVVTEDGQADFIKSGRLFTYIGEYSNANIKFSRVYYYSDSSKAYKYGSIETPGASLFDYYIVNTQTTTFTVDNKEYGILQLPTVTKIYTRYGEEYAITEVRTDVLDAVLFDNKIEYKQKSEEFNLKNLPKYVANGGITEIDDTIHGLNEVNEPLMEEVSPNWLAIDYYVYKGYERLPVNQRVKGYVKLDFSVDYSRLIK